MSGRKSKTRISWTVSSNPKQHSSGINALCLSNYLYSGSRDGKVIQWTIDNSHNPNLDSIEKNFPSSIDAENYMEGNQASTSITSCTSPLAKFVGKRTDSSSSKISLFHANKVVNSSTQIAIDKITTHNQSLAAKPNLPLFNASLEYHQDWINDMLLLFDNHLITCSSDRNILLWEINNSSLPPVKIGFHNGNSLL